MEFLVALVTAFVLVVPVELPDKTFVATLVLATRYSPGPVWLGVTLAFFSRRFQPHNFVWRHQWAFDVVHTCVHV